MANLLYNSAKVKLGDGNIDWNTDTIKAALVTTAYTPDIDAHDFWNDVSSNEASGTGYTAGGFTLASCTVTQDNTNNRAVYDATDVSASTVTTTFRYIIIYKSTGVSSTSPLILSIDTGGTQTLTAGTLNIAWNTDGIFYLA